MATQASASLGGVGFARAGACTDASAQQEPRSCVQEPRSCVQEPRSCVQEPRAHSEEREQEPKASRQVRPPHGFPRRLCVRSEHATADARGASYVPAQQDADCFTGEGEADAKVQGEARPA